MSSIKLDLSQFKHIKSDGATTTLQHKKGGHILTVLHDSLSPDNQSQLKALGQLSKDSQTSTQAQEAKAKYAKGGKVAKYCMYCGGSAHNGECKESYADGGGVLDTVKNVIKKTSDFYTEPDPDGPKPNMGTPKTSQELVEDKKPIRPQQTDRPKFADGSIDIPVVTPPRSEIPQESAPEAQPAQPKVDAGLKAKRDIYNKLVNRQNASPSLYDEPFQTDTSALFGPNGEPPKSFNSAAFQKATEMYDDQQEEATQEAAQNANKAVQDNAVRQQAGLPPVPVPTVPVAQNGSIPQDQAAAPQVNPNAANVANKDLSSAVNQAVGDTGNGIAQSSRSGLSADPGTNLMNGIQNQIQGVKGEAQAIGQLGKQEADVYRQQEMAKQAAIGTYTQKFDELRQEEQARMHDILDGQIDPQKYWKGNPETGDGGHSKIASAIGLMFGAVQQAFTGHNSPMEILKYQMDQNLASQARNLNSKENLLAHNVQEFRNLHDATDMTRIQQNEMASVQIARAASMSKDPMAQAKAQQMIGQLQVENAQRYQAVALNQAIMHLSMNPDGQPPGAVDHLVSMMQAIDPTRAKALEERMVPGAGPGGGSALAKLPVPQEVRKELVAHENLNKAASDLIQFTQSHTTLNPVSKDYAVGEQKARNLQAAVREGLLGTVYREGEQPLLDKFVSSNPAGAMKMLGNAKLMELLRSNNDRANTLKKQYGIPVQQAAQPQQEPIKGKDGRMYIKDPTGRFMIPVK